MQNCIFCKLKDTGFVFNDHAYAIWDKYPKTLGHALVITKRHMPNYLDATQEEHGAVSDLVKEVCAWIGDEHGATDFNITSNLGARAGQEIFHFHTHVIPRYDNITK